MWGGRITAWGRGHARRQDVTDAEKRAAAHAAARADAQVKLGEYLKGVIVSGGKTIGLEAVKEQRFKIELEPILVKYAKEVFSDIHTLGDGSVEALVEMEILLNRFDRYLPKKSVPKAALLSILPGGGYFYSGHIKKGIVSTVFQGAALIGIGVAQYHFSRERKSYRDATNVDEIRKHFDNSVDYYQNRNWFIGGYALLALVNAAWSTYDARQYTEQWLKQQEKKYTFAPRGGDFLLAYEYRF